MGWKESAAKVDTARLQSQSEGYLTNEAKIGLAEGIGQFADAPARLGSLLLSGGSMLAQKAGMPTERMFEANPETYNAATNYLKGLLGVKKGLKPEEDTDKIIGGVMRGVASGVVPSQMGTNFIKNYLVQLAASGAAGAGAETAGLASDDNPWAKLAGGLVGGVVVPSLLNIGSRWQTAKSALDEVPTDKAVAAAKGIYERSVDQQLKNAVAGSPGAAQNIAESMSLRNKIPGFNPSVAEMAGSEGAAQLQRQYALLNPRNMNAELARDVANKQAIESYLTRIRPKGVGSVRSGVNQALSRELSQADEAARGVAARAPVADQAAVGGRLAEIARSEKTAATPAIRAAYDDAFTAAGEAKIDIAPVIKKVEEILGSKLSEVKPDAAPETVRNLLKLVKDPAGKTDEELAYLASLLGGKVGEPSSAKAMVTLKEADEIRKAINSDIGMAERATTTIAPTRLRALSQVHATIDDSVKQSGIPEQAKKLYSDAITKYRTEFVPRFREGTNVQMFRGTSTGEPRILDEKVVSSYFVPHDQGGGTKALQFAKLFGKNDEAKHLAKQGILDRYRDAVVNPRTGMVDIGRHEAFLRDYGQSMRGFKMAGVNVIDDIERIGQAAFKADETRSAITKLAGEMRFNTTDEMINAAVGDSKLMANITMRLNPEQRQALGASLMDMAWNQGSAAKMADFIDKNQRTLRMSLSDAHLKDLRDVSKALAITERAPLAGHIKSGAGDILKEATNVSMATVWAQMRATSAGRQAPVTMAFNLAAPIMSKLSQTQFDDVMQRALHDPKTAEALHRFLISNEAGKANMWAGKLMDGLKTSGRVLWDAKGNIVSAAIGGKEYGKNLARSGRAIAGNMAEEQ